METLIIIGIGLALVTAMLAVVDHMAEMRGRHRGAWTFAAFVGICFAAVGWLVVVAALFIAGPSQEQRANAHPDVTAAPHPGHP